MKKALILFILISLLVLLIGPYAPYWVLMIGVSIVAFLIGARNAPSFFSAGLSFGLTWMGLALFISIKTDSELPIRMAELMGMQNDNLLLFGTAILGFLIGSLSGLTGSMAKKLFQRKV
ncbi:hypothetical protein M3O96_12945 [Aquiflexum sp. TKW24L]|uniref:hypothetical protein n=1 Tax=Aquiflexum sp. TKW24L TaxID=2942212 RepID=UPI0020C0AB2F|nr:hypothetical protein [Aquiflexum sp. TKW24L]MCL6260002.1 hypothetical protein [Aquiflexum sp. TKW24L]